MTSSVCFLSSLHAPLDKRVHYKEAIALVRMGLDVTHVAPGNLDGQMVDGVKMVCFEGRKSAWGRIRQLGRLYHAALGVNADVFHANELDSWLVAVILKLRRRSRVVFDVHELYSSNISERLFPKPVRPAVETLVRTFIRLLLPFTDRIVFAKKSVQKDFPAMRDKIVLVQNFVDTGGAGPANRCDRADTGKVVVLHLGSINRARGWPQLLDAMREATNPALALSVIGQFGDGTEEDFKESVSALGLEGRVDFKPWIPYEDVPKYAAMSHIGIVSFQPVHQNFIHALPHKLFDYMWAGLPVVVPEFATEVREIVARSGCGLLVDTTQPRAIARALDTLANDPGLRQEMGEKGRKAVIETYNWEREAEKLVAMYRSILPD